jgi:protein ImuB
MKRILCIRFPNWPVQCLQHRLRADKVPGTALALHTAMPVAQEQRAPKLPINEDIRFLRSLYPAAQGGPAIVAVSADAWARGVRPGMPLAEARSMAVPVRAAATKNQKLKKRIESSEPSIEFHEWHPEHDRRQLKEAAELTRPYAPVVGLDAVPMPDSLLLDITGCGPLFGGEAGLAESLLKDLHAAGWYGRIAIAHSVAAVWALTHTDTPIEISARQEANRGSDRQATHRMRINNVRHELPIQIVPVGQHQSEIQRLPVSASRLGLKDLEILKHLGLRTIGQLLGLPREDLPSRLSADGVLRIQQLADAIDEPIIAIPEANPVATVWSTDDPACGLNDIRHILLHLTEQIAEQLLRRRMACSQVTCLFSCVDGSSVSVPASLVKPTQSHELLHEVLCMRIETAITHSVIESTAAGTIDRMSTANFSRDESVGAPAAGQIASLDCQPFCRVTMTAAVSMIPVARQRDLFSPVEHIVPQEELASLITRLSGRLGHEAVLTAHTNSDARPEHSIRLDPVLPEDPSLASQSQRDAVLSSLTDPAPVGGQLEPGVARPLRLLAVPQLIARTNGERNFPRQVMLSGKAFELAEFSSAERIQTAWWTDQPCHRDYYQATSRTGSRFWLFRDLQSGEWYVHGVFD